jgi:hypothetical protein
MTILLFYTSLVKVTKTVSVPKPALEQYEQLYSKYSQTLTCSCNKISINYGEFIHINYTLHQVCSSSLLTKEWIDYLAPSTTIVARIDSFESAATHSFQALSTLCDLINKTISDGLTQFHSKQYITATVTSLKLFETEIQSLIDEFKSSIINSFLLSLLTIQNITQGNALHSALGTNYVPLALKPGYPISLVPRSYNGCSCFASSKCITPSYSWRYSKFYLPNFYAGCYVIESLLQSTLECFYTQSCIDQIQDYSVFGNKTVKALNSSSSNEYLENSTIQGLLNKLMIEKWNSSKLYYVYYNECNPKNCTYILQTRNDIIHIFTTLFAVAGGLIKILKLVVPALMKIVRKKRQRLRSANGKTK